MDDSSTTQHKWPGLAVRALVVVLLVGVAVAIAYFASAYFSDEEMTFEEAVMQSLADNPKDYSSFMLGVTQRRELHERELWYLRDLVSSDPIESSQMAVRDERHSGDSPVVWSEGRNAQDVAKYYSVWFHGGGGCWGGGGPRGYISVYVGYDGEIVGWFTPEAAWRAKVLEMMNSKRSGGGR